jgi:hypothetical protein
MTVLPVAMAGDESFETQQNGGIPRRNDGRHATRAPVRIHRLMRLQEYGFGPIGQIRRNDFQKLDRAPEVGLGLA